MTTERNGVRSAEIIALEDRVLAHNYHPLPVVIESGEGAWVTDVDGRSYLDCLAAYSALNFGHGHPGLLRVAREQLDRVTLTSRAFHSDQLALFAQKLADLAGVDMVLPMNTGAEAVESAIKVARKWAYDVKGVPDGAARIIVAEGNFHGRTSTIISFSTDPAARDGFGPYMPGFDVVPYGDLDALAAAVTSETAAVLIEPIQGEAGVLIPPEGYLAGVRSLCDREGMLFIADEVQSGLGRAGATFACDVEGVRPDVYVLGKALGGGIVPVSAVLAGREVLGVLHPGQHGSTFGGNPLAAAVGGAVVDLLATGEYQKHARELSPVLEDGLRSLIGKGVVDVRVRGLWAGVDIDPALGTGRDVSAALAERGVLVKDTHGSTIRLAPPLVIERSDLDWGVGQLADALTALAALE